MAEWTAVASAQVLAPAGRALLRVNGVEVAVFRVGEALYALEDGCPHGGASLCTGRLEDGHVQCRAHGLRFRLADGGLAGSAIGPTRSAMTARVFPIRELDGWLQLQFDAAAPPPGASSTRSPIERLAPPARRRHVELGAEPTRTRRAMSSPATP